MIFAASMTVASSRMMITSLRRLAIMSSAVGSLVSPATSERGSGTVPDVVIPSKKDDPYAATTRKPIFARRLQSTSYPLLRVDLALPETPTGFILGVPNC